MPPKEDFALDAMVQSQDNDYWTSEKQKFDTRKGRTSWMSAGEVFGTRYCSAGT